LGTLWTHGIGSSERTVDVVGEVPRRTDWATFGLLDGVDDASDAVHQAGDGASHESCKSDADALREPADALLARSIDRLAHDAGDTADGVGDDPLHALADPCAHAVRLPVEVLLPLALVVPVEGENGHSVAQRPDDARRRPGGSVDHVVGQTASSDVDAGEWFSLSRSGRHVAPGP